MSVRIIDDSSSEAEQVWPWLNGINGESLPKLIESDSRVIRVVAGPGSGKTLGLQRRVQRILHANEVDPSRIFVGTFTRAITGELASALGEEVVQGIRVSTLHSLGYKLLRENPVALEQRSLRLLLNFEESPMLYDLGHAMDDSSSQSTRRQLLKRLQADYAHKRELGEAAFAGELDRWLRRHGGILVDEIVPFATSALESHDISPGIYDHVLIDEYQDLTACEQALVELVWSQRGSLVVLGDDDQSIYGFRFNHPGGITEFHNRWAKSEFEDVPMSDNHRSAEDIVGAANTMMAESGASKPPMLSRYSGLGSVTRVHWPTLDDEIAGLAKYIGNRSDQQFLVLVPLRMIGYRLQEAVGPDAQTSFSEGLLEHRVVQERFTLASLVANHDDHIALRVWLSLRSDKPEPQAQRNTIAYASALSSGLQGHALIQAIDNGQISIQGTGKSHVNARAKNLLECIATMPEALDEKIEKLFDSSWADELEEEEKRKWASKGLDTIRNAALRLGQREDINDLAGVMNRLRYQIATRVPLYESDTPRVTITTLHSAKGLQADSVIVAGLADQMLPGVVEDEEDREERRRLLYVAVTRPRNELIVSWPRQMRFEDAVQNNVRIDQGSVRTFSGGERRVKLGRSSLLPRDFPGPQMAGENWLSDSLTAVEKQAQSKPPLGVS